MASVAPATIALSGRAPRISAIALPILGELALQAGASALITWLLSQQSAAAAVAVNTTLSLVFFFCVLGRFVTMGAAVVVTQYLGAARRDSALQLAGSAFHCSVWLGLASAVVLSVGAAPMLAAWSFPPELMPFAVPYLRWTAFTLIVEVAAMCLLALLRAYGHARIGLHMNLASYLLQLVGIGAVLHGVDGPVLSKMTALAGVALLSRAAFMLGLWRYQRGVIALRWAPRAPIVWSTLKPAMAIGVPAAAEYLAYQVSFFAIMKMIGSMGATALIAQAFARQVMNMTMLPCLALGLATEVVIGYQVGAGQLAAAARLMQRCLIGGVATGTLLALLAALFAGPLLGWFTTDAAIIAAGIPLLQVGVVLEVGRSINLVVINGLRASGDVQFPARIGVLSMWGLQAPLAYLLGLHTPLLLTGVWIAYAADEWVRGAGNLWRWQQGHWRRRARAARRRIAGGVS